jgi:hypothetical protein
MAASTTAMFWLSLAKAGYEFAVAIIYFMALIRSVHIITPWTFMWLAVWECGVDLIYLFGLMVSPWCNGGRRIVHWWKYVTFYVASAWFSSWLFAGTVFFYVTYKDEIVGAPSPVDDPNEFSIIHFLYVYGFGMVAVFHVVRYYWLWMKLGKTEDGAPRFPKSEIKSKTRKPTY